MQDEKKDIKSFTIEELTEEFLAMGRKNFVPHRCLTGYIKEV